MPADRDPLDELREIVQRRKTSGADVARIQVDSTGRFVAAVRAALGPLLDPVQESPSIVTQLWGIPVEGNHWIPPGYGVQLDAKGNVVGMFQYERADAGAVVDRAAGA